MERGTICFTTVGGGLDHDQGTRQVLVIGRTELGAVTGETIVLPISHIEPRWTYPLSWPIPHGLFPQPAWVLINRPRAALISRLRDSVAVLETDQLDEIATGLRQLIESS